jgi:hypothetical protein
MEKVELHTSAKEFVDPKVKTIPVTEDIIAKIMPFFPKSAKVISGYLSEDDLYWKVNYHWEVLLEAMEHCAGLDLEKMHKDSLERFKKDLRSNSPDPSTGYRKSPTPGIPKDTSSHQKILERHTVVTRAKKDFKALVEAADVFKKTKRDPKALLLAYAPVAKPAQGKHSTGYALDIMIAGNNLEVRRIAALLGAVKPFDEGSHVHCEWPNGVDLTCKGGANAQAASARAARMSVDNKIIAVRHCLLRWTT